MPKNCDAKQQIGGTNKKGAMLIDSIDVCKPKIHTLDKTLQGILESQKHQDRDRPKARGRVGCMINLLVAAFLVAAIIHPHIRIVWARRHIPKSTACYAESAPERNAPREMQCLRDET